MMSGHAMRMCVFRNTMMHRTILGIVKIIQLFSDLARRDDNQSLKMVTDTGQKKDHDDHPLLHTDISICILCCIVRQATIS